MTQNVLTESRPTNKSFLLKTFRHLGACLLAGAAGFAAIFLLALLGDATGLALIIAPFGATAVLIFALPDSPLAQPRNVIGGHILSAIIGVTCLLELGATPLVLALGVGIAIAAMSLTRTLHPPAGANPLVIILTGATWKFLFVPILCGAVFLVTLGVFYRRLKSVLPAARN